MLHSPVIRIVKQNNQTKLIKEQVHFKNKSEIKKIEAQMKYIFFHKNATKADVIEYNRLEAQWKKLTTI